MNKDCSLELPLIQYKTLQHKAVHDSFINLENNSNCVLYKHKYSYLISAPPLTRPIVFKDVDFRIFKDLYYTKKVIKIQIAGRFSLYIYPNGI